jgi:phospholipid/cholesterol/gamma-HCH transport system substrate-binding protein
MKRAIVLALAALTALSVTGCSSYRGINSLSLPGDVGTGAGSYQVKVQLPNAANMVPNTPVMINDIDVGTVTNVALEGWTPTLTLSLLPSVHLPANAVASLGQTSILGSKHIELSAPKDAAAQGTLAPGALITEDRSHAYPQTEDLLASVSLLLNGGGLQNFQVLTSELNRAFGGREQDTRALLTQLNNFTGGLDKQKDDIVSALQSADRLSGTLAPRMGEINDALQYLPEGLDTLRDEEGNLRHALNRLADASGSIAPFSDHGSHQLRNVFHDLEPVLRHVGDTQRGTMMQALKLLPFVIFPLDNIPYSFRGDYVNIILTLDLTNEALDKAFLTGTPAAGLLMQGTKALKGKMPSLPGLQATDPLKLPLRGPGDKKDGKNPVAGLLGSSAPKDSSDDRDEHKMLPKALPGFGG